MSNRSKISATPRSEADRRSQGALRGFCLSQARWSEKPVKQKTLKMQRFFQVLRDRSGLFPLFEPLSRHLAAALDEKDVCRLRAVHPHRLGRDGMSRAEQYWV